jgi:short-subunit dehydrogenase
MKKTIIITGASSGLGRAMALEYAKQNPGLFLFGRSKEELEKTASLCKLTGATDVTILVSDVRDKESIKDHIEAIIGHHGIDTVIACAGVSAGTLDGMEGPEQVETIFETNLSGVINTIMPAIPHMISRQAGNIVIISSMAGVVGLSSSPSYSASKGGVRIFGQALRGYLRKYKVNVSVVIPGYIKTPMTEVNDFPMPFMISAEKAAQKIIRNVEKGKGIIAFPWIMYAILRLLELLPNSLFDYINSKLPGKPSFENRTKKD